MQYGKEWRKMNKWVKSNIQYLVCENDECQGTARLTLHHFITRNERRSHPEIGDMPEYWIVLCHSCHWYANRYPYQPFQVNKRIEIEKILHDGFSATESLTVHMAEKSLLP